MPKRAASATKGSNATSAPKGAKGRAGVRKGGSSSSSSSGPTKRKAPASSSSSRSSSSSSSGGRKPLARTIRKRTQHPHSDEEALAEAQRELAEGATAKTAASAFVHEEMHAMKEGSKKVRSPAQAIAVGLSKARRAGIPVPEKCVPR